MRVVILNEGSLLQRPAAHKSPLTWVTAASAPREEELKKSSGEADSGWA